MWPKFCCPATRQTSKVSQFMIVMLCDDLALHGPFDLWIWAGLCEPACLIYPSPARIREVAAKQGTKVINYWTFSTWEDMNVIECIWISLSHWLPVSIHTQYELVFQCKLGNFWTWICEKLLDLDVLRLDHLSDFICAKWRFSWHLHQLVLDSGDFNEQTSELSSNSSLIMIIFPGPRQASVRCSVKIKLY